MNCQIGVSSPDPSVEEIQLPTEHVYEESPLTEFKMELTSPSHLLLFLCLLLL